MKEEIIAIIKILNQLKSKNSKSFQLIKREVIKKEAC